MRWRKDHGHRQANEDHRGDGTGADPGDGAISFIAGAEAGTGSRLTAVGTYAGLYSGIYLGGTSGTHLAEPASPKPLNLPVEKSNVAIRALKVARLTRMGESVALLAAMNDTRHLADDTAVCLASGSWIIGTIGGTHPVASHTHDVPVPECSCGFYALKDYSQLDVTGNNRVVLDIELSGRVIECERGYRAQRQRILGVRVPNQCGGWLCDAPATVLSFKSEGLRAYCDEHRSGKRQATLAQVAGILGTEVRWAERVAGSGR